MNRQKLLRLQDFGLRWGRSALAIFYEAGRITIAFANADPGVNDGSNLAVPRR
jgi:hypothetical protein